MFDCKGMTRLGVAAFAVSTVISSQSPALSNPAYVSLEISAARQRAEASHTDGQAAVIEALLARSAVNQSQTPILFDDSLGKKVAAWAREHGAGKFTVTPVVISGQPTAVAFYDPPPYTDEAYRRVNNMFIQNNGQYIPGMKLLVNEYRAHGVSSFSTIDTLDSEQLFSVTQFASSVSEHNEANNKVLQDPNTVLQEPKKQTVFDRLGRMFGVEVLRAAGNIYYGQLPKDAARDIINQGINDGLGSVIRGVQR